MTTEILKGIVSPSIDNLLSKVDSKYELVMFAANRARQINQYYAELQAGSLFNNVGPLVEATVDEKALTIALREIDQNKLVKTPTV
jgi:DNA-directed RNA polymerase subunit omega